MPTKRSPCLNNTMIDETPLLRRLHQVYVQDTRLDVPLNMGRMDNWHAWRSHGFTEQDLILVIRNLKAKIKDGRKWESALHFSKLIRETDVFEEELAEARAKQRERGQRIDPARAQALRESGRPPVQVIATARSAADIIAGDEAFARFRELKHSL